MYTYLVLWAQVAFYVTVKAQALGDGSAICQNSPTTNEPFSNNIAPQMCSCNPGYTNVSQSCQPCPPGTYKSAQGSSVCLPCPSNSNSSVNGSSQCPCLEGYYRPAGSGADSVCIAARPPSAPLGLMANAPSTTAVVLSWSPPQDSGGMGTVFYTVYYQALISGSLRMTWGNATTTSVTVTNLLPATEYRMTVVAQNGLPGDEGNSSASLNVTTQSALQSTSTLVIVGVASAFVALIGVLLFVLLLVILLKHKSKMAKLQGTAVTLSQPMSPSAANNELETIALQPTQPADHTPISPIVYEPCSVTYEYPLSTQPVQTMDNAQSAYQGLSTELMSSPSTYENHQSTQPVQSIHCVISSPIVSTTYENLQPTQPAKSTHDTRSVQSVDTPYQQLSKKHISSPSTYEHPQSTQHVQSISVVPSSPIVYETVSMTYENLQSNQPAKSMQDAQSVDTAYQRLSKELLSPPSTYEHPQSTQSVKPIQSSPIISMTYENLQSTQPAKSMHDVRSVDTAYQQKSKKLRSSSSTYEHPQCTQPVESMYDVPSADTVYEPLSMEFKSSPSKYMAK